MERTPIRARDLVQRILDLDNNRNLPVYEVTTFGDTYPIEQEDIDNIKVIPADVVYPERIMIYG